LEEVNIQKKKKKKTLELLMSCNKKKKKNTVNGMFKDRVILDIGEHIYDNA